MNKKTISSPIVLSTYQNNQEETGLDVLKPDLRDTLKTLNQRNYSSDEGNYFLLESDEKILGILEKTFTEKLAPSNSELECKTCGKQTPLKIKKEHRGPYEISFCKNCKSLLLIKKLRIRQHQRHQVDKEVQVEGIGLFHNAKVKDLSQFGAKIKILKEYKKGSKVQIRCNAFDAKGSVAWVKKMNAKGLNPFFELGIQFDEFRVKDKEAFFHISC